MLPLTMRWEDDSRTVVNGRVMFMTETEDGEDHIANIYKYTRDIQASMLRTRYYYAQYMIYRPLIYKALHFPERMTKEDIFGVSVCLKVRLILCPT